MKLLHIKPVKKPTCIAIQWDGTEITDEVRTVVGDSGISYITVDSSNRLIIIHTWNRPNTYVPVGHYIVREEDNLSVLSPEKFDKQWEECKAIDKHTDQSNPTDNTVWPYETCDHCGCEYRFSMHIKDKTWIAVNGKEGGCLCINCFVMIAQEKKIKLSVDDFEWLWVFDPDGKSFDVIGNGE